MIGKMFEGMTTIFPGIAGMLPSVQSPYQPIACEDFGGSADDPELSQGVLDLGNRECAASGGR